MIKTLPILPLLISSIASIDGTPPRDIAWLPSTHDHKQSEWTGEVVDIACYVSSEATGEANKTCHEATKKELETSGVNNAQPMGLLTDDGTLVLIVANAKNAEAFASVASNVGKTVTVKADHVERNGIAVLVI